MSWFRKEIPEPRKVDLNSPCPACGHRGCTLKYIPPLPIEINEKGATTIQLKDAKVARTCNTCGAVAYENTILYPDKWIAK